MDANTFIKLMKSDNARNNDIPVVTWAVMERIAKHYENCEECRTAFDEMEYTDEYLFEIAARIDTTDEKDWMCAADPDFGL